MWPRVVRADCMAGGNKWVSERRDRDNRRGSNSEGVVDGKHEWILNREESGNGLQLTN